MLLMWMRILRACGYARQLLDHPAGAGLRQMAHGSGGLAANRESDHLVFGPERAVDEKAVRTPENGAKTRLDPAQARCVEKRMAGRLVGHEETDIVARMRVIAVRRIRWRLARQGNHVERQSGRAVDAKAAVAVDPAPFHAAIMLEDAEQRVGNGEIVAYWIGAVDAQGAAFTQHHEAGRVIDLAVHENDADDPGVPYGAAGLRFREAPELRQNVRGSIEQDPICAIGADRNGRLGARTRPEVASAQAIAVAAIAVPLRKPAARSGAENVYSHNATTGTNDLRAVRARGKPMPVNKPRPDRPAAGDVNASERTL